MHAQTFLLPSPSPPPGVLDVQAGRMSVPAGRPVYVEGDPSHILYTVVAGAIRTVRHSVEGRRQVGGFYFPGDVLGPDGAERHLFSAEAMRPTALTLLHRNHPRYRDETQRALMEDLRRTHAHLAMVGRRSAEERVASFLMEMAARGASRDVNLPMNRQDMADYLGLAMETVCRVLGQFQERGLVAFTTRRDFHIIRNSALSRLADT